jgi:hypothetical protein
MATVGMKTRRARESGHPGYGRARTTIGAMLMALLATGCRSGEPRLPLVDRRPIAADSAASLYASAAGQMLSLPAGLTGLAEMDGTLYARTTDTLMAIASETGAVLAARAEFAGTIVIPDVRGRFLLQGAQSGAVFAHDPVTLEAIWGWASRGARTTALAGSIEGDVLYQALDGGDDGGFILTRDVQTGRVLAGQRFQNRVDALMVTRSGDLIALLVDGGGGQGDLMRLRPRVGEMSEIWIQPLDLSPRARATLDYSSAVGLVAVFQPGVQNGLRVVDAEAGTLVGTVTESATDAAFTSDGALYLLMPSELARVWTGR